MRFAQMSDMLYKLGATYAVNLDGGGSARVLVKGKVFGNPTENRQVDNVIAFYLKNSDTSEPVVSRYSLCTLYS